MPIPPPEVAELLEKLQFVTTTDDEALLYIAPPVLLAELPENMQLINVMGVVVGGGPVGGGTDEVWLNIAPPVVAVLPENVQPVIMGEE